MADAIHGVVPIGLHLCERELRERSRSVPLAGRLLDDQDEVPDEPARHVLERRERPT